MSRFNTLSLFWRSLQDGARCTETRVFVSTQVLVPGTTTTALLQQLLPNTDYNVGVVALYSDGEGPAISDAGKTSKNLFRDRAI